MIRMEFEDNSFRLLNEALKYKLHFKIESGSKNEIQRIKSLNYATFYSGMLYYNDIPVCFILITRRYINNYLWMYYTKQNHRKKGFCKKLINFMIEKTNLQPNLLIYDGNLHLKECKHQANFAKHNNIQIVNG